MQQINWRWAGIYILALISIMFAIAAIINIGVLILQVRGNLDNDLILTQQSIWTAFLGNMAVIILFGATAYGLWRHENWGRVIFLWAITIWSAANLIFYLGESDFTLRGQLFNLARYTIAPIWSLWYLNRPEVKSIFIDGLPLEKETDDI